MSISAKDVVDAALKLLSHVNAAGVIDQAKEARFYGMAPAYLTVLTYELAGCEGVTGIVPVTSLNQQLTLSDETALKALPAGLAMYFSLAERDSVLYNHFSKVYYESFMPSVKSGETEIEDYYGVKCDPTFR
jgi:hypothetical protein